MIKNGVYVEKLTIKTKFIALVGEDRDSTCIQFYQPYSFDSTYADGRAVINIFANDGTLAIMNCSILSNGGDTLALWNGEAGMYYHYVRPAGNYDWYKDNLSTAPGTAKPEAVTPAWTFAGAWSPEANVPSVLPMAFLPKPDYGKTGVELAPKLTWVAGRNAKSHRIYFGTGNPPKFAKAVTEPFFIPAKLRPKTVYYWRVDEVTDDKGIEGKVWQFRTR